MVSEHVQEPVRSWRVVAQELSQETDPKRVLELSHELNEALKRQQIQIPSDGDGNSH